MLTLLCRQLLLEVVCLCLFVPLATYSTESRGNLVRGSLHDADKCGYEAHLHGALAAFDLCQFLKDVLSQGCHHRVWGEERRQGLRKDKRLSNFTCLCFLWEASSEKVLHFAKRNMCHNTSFSLIYSNLYMHKLENEKPQTLTIYPLFKP